MAQSVNTDRFDPYRNFRFRIRWDGREVAGVSKVSALKRTTEVIERPVGGNHSTVHKLPGQTKYEAITLERAVTHDEEFERWANKVGQSKYFRKDIILDIYNDTGRRAISYKVYGCWVSEFQPLSEFDASANGLAIETLKLENEGWERDTAVVEPLEPKVIGPE